MPLTESTLRDRIRDFLKRHAPYSVIDRGLESAVEGLVTECGRTGSTIQGIVKTSSEEEENFTVSLKVISTNEIEAECSCSSKEDMSEQWCHHAVALLWRAVELGFFEHQGGFAATESVYRMNTSTPDEIAAVLNEIKNKETITTQSDVVEAKVVVEVDHSSDRLGVQVRFGKEVQEPLLFEGFKDLSSRTLDNLLLELLDEYGSWDEFHKRWYINSSDNIETILGLLSEFSDVRSSTTGKKLVFSKKALDAVLRISWSESAAELEISWKLPDGSRVPKFGELIGTGPYWTVIDDTVYRVSLVASRIASIFPYGSRITLPRSQVGPILEVLQDELYDRNLIEIVNAELQPDTAVKTPKPILDLKRRDADSEHFTSQTTFKLKATLEFEYPEPPKNKNLVYLPNREKEQDYFNFLKSLGFRYVPDKRNFRIEGDDALDLVQMHTKIFPKEWELNGISAIKSNLKLADLSLKVSLSSSANEGKLESSKIDWFDCHISLVQNNANIPLSTIFKSVQSGKRRWIRLDSGAYARVPGGNIEHLKTTLGVIDPHFRLSNTIKTRLSSAQAISLSRIDDNQFEINTDKKLAALSKKLDDFSRIPSIKESRSFEGSLRQYQLDGISWLNFLNEFELGGILADEMGLGKTVQTLCLLQYLKDSRSKTKKLTGPALVVAPTSVITNWAYEAKRFTPKLKVLLLHGPQRKQHFSSIEDHDLVITSYALLRLDRYELEGVTFSYIILDEAQNIKNPIAATTKAAKSLKAYNRLALTGTPTENRPQELWSILDFLMPGYLGSLEFFRSFVEKPILESGTDVDAIKFLKSKTRPFILRRLKSEVEKDLPPKVESELHVEMSDSQKDLYTQILAEVRPKVFEAVEKKGVGGASVSILAALLRLRQVCNHPNSIEGLKHLPGYDSGKFGLFQEIVTEALESGRKILVFSQFREMLAIMRRWLESIEQDYLYLDGTTRNRQQIVDQFNEDPSTRLFLISLKAGGTGLNLTAADTVIIYDPWWNPAVEDQAVDRAHRIGQTKAVTVYRLVTENSIEQKIMILKSKKNKIVDALINENTLSPRLLSKSDLEELFKPFPESESN